MSECSHNCSTCGESCSSRTQDKKSFLEALAPESSVKKVIGVVSGKGGVGKSLVTSMMAVSMSRRGKHAAILDADITGPSIPMAFGVAHEKAGVSADGKLMIPARSLEGVDIMSANLLLDHDTDPVIWRGPVIAGVVKQFWNETAWGDIDYLFVDMPPGTGDVPLTVFQSLPVDGIVIVTSPQELVNMIVKKAYNMAEAMHITVLGVVENFSYLKCPDCGKEIKLFGESHIDEIAKELSVPVLGKLPLDTSYAAIADKGDFYSIENDHLAKATEVLERI
mgnify:CR=1 FL=1